MSQTLMNTICQKNAISDLMLLAASYPMYIKKSQIKYWANSRFISRICQLCKSFLPSIWSVLWCVLVEIHLQDCQKTKCIFTAPSKSLIKQCLMKPKAISQFFSTFFFPQWAIYENSKEDDRHLSGTEEGYLYFRYYQMKVQVPFFTSRGTWRRDLFYSKGLQMPTLNPHPFTGEFIKSLFHLWKRNAHNTDAQNDVCWH